METLYVLRRRAVSCAGSGGKTDLPRRASVRSIIARFASGDKGGGEKCRKKRRPVAAEI